MYRVVVLVAGVAFLVAAAVLHTGLQTGSIRPPDSTLSPETPEAPELPPRPRGHVGRVFYLLVGGGLLFTGLGLREILFPGRGNEAIERKRKRERERSRGVIRR